MWGEQRGDPGWNGQRDAPWNSQPDPNWNSQFEGPWNSQHEQPPWGGGQREPPFRMQRPPHFRGPFPPHQQHPQFNQPPHPHNFNRFPPRFMQDDFPPRHPFERPPYPHRFDYPQGDFPAGECAVSLEKTVCTVLSCPWFLEKSRLPTWRRHLTVGLLSRLMALLAILGVYLMCPESKSQAESQNGGEAETGSSGKRGDLQTGW